MPFQKNRLLATLVACAALSAVATPLPPLNIDKSQTTVSGTSSGGYMAVQLNVAYSSRFGKGVAAIAGGPFNCAENSVIHALTRCFGKAAIPVEALIETTKKWAGENAIDATSSMSNSKVYIFSGSKDAIVQPSTSDALAKYYAAFVHAANIVIKKDIPAAHGFVTDEGVAACDSVAAPFLNNCGFDLSAALLQHLYGPLAAKKSGALEGTLQEFDQAPYEGGRGMGTTGYVFVPKSCAAGQSCRLHVALHGCKQNAGDVGNAFAKNAGYNRWADSNNIVVLYPQTGKGATNGCWDWWGYDNASYAKKGAPQMKAIVDMLERLSSGSKK